MSLFQICKIKEEYNQKIYPELFCLIREIINSKHDLFISIRDGKVGVIFEIVTEKDPLTIESITRGTLSTCKDVLITAFEDVYLKLPLKPESLFIFIDSIAQLELQKEVLSALDRNINIISDLFFLTDKKCAIRINKKEELYKFSFKVTKNSELIREVTLEAKTLESLLIKAMNISKHAIDLTKEEQN